MQHNQILHLEANKALIGVQEFIQKFPELKANEQYNQLIQSINNEVSSQREKYNESVRSTIPNVLQFPESPYLDFMQENMEHTILK